MASAGGTKNRKSFHRATQRTACVVHSLQSHICPSVFYTLRRMGCATSHEVTAKSQGARRVAVPIVRFQPIPDRYETIGDAIRTRFDLCTSPEEVQHDLRKAGLESSNLIVAWTGKRSFGGQCLHAIDPLGRLLNPYQHLMIGWSPLCNQSVISIIGRVLEAFDDDNIIPAFGFGDVSTQGDKCFSFALPDQPGGCQGFDDVLRRYNEITPTLTLHGPTNFAPVIHEAIRIVQRDGGYHILVIVADGQVTNEDQTRQAIIEASKWPISIIMVGVGDGPWGLMNEFDDKLPARSFDNFQFVEYNAVMQLNKKNPEAGFAIAALMEIPGTRT
ncbi:Copine-like protein, partial [Globisporangium splendens]